MIAELIQDTHTIVRATGEIDIANVAEFEKPLDEAAQSAPDGFILDLTDTSYLDSAGVQAILAVYIKMRESDGCLAVVVGNVRITSVLEVVHLEQLPGVCVCASLDEARQAMAASVGIV